MENRKKVQKEASETQTWLEFAVESGYLSKQEFELLFERYEHIIAQLITMETKASTFCKTP